MSIIAILDHISDGNDDSLYSDLCRGSAILQLKEVIKTDSNDVTTGFYLQQVLADGHAFDESVRVLEQLTKHRPVNSAQKSIMPQIDQLYQTRKKIVEDPSRQPPPKILSWEDVKAYRSFNRLGTLASLLNGSEVQQFVSRLTQQQKIECQRWLIGIGVYQGLNQWFALPQGQGIEGLMSDESSEVSIDKHTALDHELFQLTERFPFDDESRFRQRLLSLESKECTPAQKRVLTRFRDLLIDVSGKR
jgi:hypothetical protein